jgi:protein-tyrosine phosphatase
MLDFHNHLMPGVDDGAADIAESRGGLRTLQSHGVHRIVTTPHLRASLTHRPDELARALDKLDEAWAALESLAEAEFPELQIDRGVELMLDTPHSVLDDPRVRLAGTSFVLVEFPFMSIPPQSTNAVREITRGGVTPVIAHPERYDGMSSNYALVEDWKDAGAVIQVNSGSLLGYYGSTVERLAWLILRDGLADYLSSDYHSRGKCAVGPCAEMMRSNGAEREYRSLAFTNPERLVAGQFPLPVPPVTPTEPMWKRVLLWR